MTKHKMHLLLTSKGFRKLDNLTNFTMYRKIYPGEKLRWYLEMEYDGDLLKSINGKDPEETLSKIRNLK